MESETNKLDLLGGVFCTLGNQKGRKMTNESRMTKRFLIFDEPHGKGTLKE